MVSVLAVLWRIRDLSVVWYNLEVLYSIKVYRRQNSAQVGLCIVGGTPGQVWVCLSGGVG